MDVQLQPAFPNGMLSELFGHLSDPADDVRNAIRAALVHLGSKNPREVIFRCHTQLEMEVADKPTNRCTILLEVLEEIFHEHLQTISEPELFQNLLGTIFKLLEQTVEVSTNLKFSKALMNIVVSLSSLFCREVMEHLLSMNHAGPNKNGHAIALFGELASHHSHNIMHLLPVLLSQTPKFSDRVVPLTDESSLFITLGQYCDASLEYLATVGDSQDSWDVMVDLLSSHTCAAIDYIITSLSPFAKDHQPSLALMANVGSIMSLTEFSYLFSHLPKLLGYLINQLKKAHSPTDLSIVRSLDVLFEIVSKRCAVRGAESVNETKKLFEIELDNLIACLFHRLTAAMQATYQSDSADSVLMSTKLSNELKRAFALLCLLFPQRILAFVETHLHSGSEWIRGTSLNLLRHLVASCTDSSIDSVARRSILANLQLILHTDASPSTVRRSSRATLMGTVVIASPLSEDRSSKILGTVVAGSHLPNIVRYELGKMVLTLGSQGYLDSHEQIHTSFIEFIVRQCASPILPTNKAFRGPGQSEIRDVCEHVLKLSSSTIPSMRPVLWPFLLEFILCGECVEAVGPVCDSIANVFSKLMIQPKSDEPGSSTREPDEDSDVVLRNFDNLELNTRGVKPDLLLARLLVLLGLPFRGKMRGLPILRALKCLAIFIHSSLPRFWEIIIPRMMLYLTQHSSTMTEDSQPSQFSSECFKQEHWEALILKMLARTVEVVADEKWSLLLLRAFESQVTLYEADPEEKGFLLKCLSVVLRSLALNPVVTEAVEFIVQATNHESSVEQESCSDALGRVSEAHRSLVLDYLQNRLAKLNTAVKNEHSQSSVAAHNRISTLFRSSIRSPKSGSPPASNERTLRSVVSDSIRVTIILAHSRIVSQGSTEDKIEYIGQLIKTVIPTSLSFPNKPRIMQLAIVRLIGQISTALKSLQSACLSLDCSKLWTVDLSMYLLELLAPSVRSCDCPSTAESVVPFSLPSMKPDLILFGDYDTQLSILNTLLDVLLLGLQGCDERLRKCLLVTAAVSLPANKEEQPLGIIGDKGKLPFDRVSSKEESLLNFPLVEIVAEPSCFSTVRMIWTSIVQSACSDEVMNTMIMTLLPYLYQKEHHTVFRTLQLLSAILSTMLVELRVVNKVGVPPAFCGQLLGHLTLLLDRSHPFILRREVKRCLSELLRIQNLFSDEGLDSDNEVSDPLQFHDGDFLLSSSILYLHARSISKPQLMPLLHLLLSNSSRYVSELRSTDVHQWKAEPTVENAETGSLHLSLSTGRISRFAQLLKTDSRPRADNLSLYKPDQLACELTELFHRLSIPCSGLGYVVRLFVCLIACWVADLTDLHVKTILHAAHDLYPRLNDPGIRVGLLHAVALLGTHWPLLCVQLISSNPLPFDDTWTAFLSSIAFIPVRNLLATSIPRVRGNNLCAFSAEQSHDEPTVLEQKPCLLELFSYVLRSLDQCQPYEQRSVPVSLLMDIDRGSRLLITSDDSTIQNANFATHFWLSTINCLQILSGPIVMEDLVDHYYFSSQHQSVSVPMKPFNRLLRRPPLTPPNDYRVESSSLCLSLCEQLTEPTLFSRLLGHWILAYGTASICQTLSGKSYECRSEAEANLRHGLMPVCIVLEGINRFLHSCDLLELADLLDFPRILPTTKLQNESICNSMWDKRKLLDPDFLEEFINVIIGYLAKFLKPVYSVKLVLFFLPYLDSTYEIRRRLAVLVAVAVLSRLPLINTCKKMTDHSKSDSVDADTLLDCLLRHIPDRNRSIRLLIIRGLRHIVPATFSPDPSGASSGYPETFYSDPRVALMRNYGGRVILPLLTIIDEEDMDLESPLLLASLESLSALLPCLFDHQVNALVPNICHRILPIYSVSNSSVRLACFNLFGILTRLTCDPVDSNHLNSSHDAILAESTSMFVPLLLHLADPSEPVVQACKSTLKHISALLFPMVPETDGPASANKATARIPHFFQTCLRPELRLHLGEFYNELSKLLVSVQPDNVVDHIMRCTIFFKSDLSPIQCSALLLSSSLIRHLPVNTLSIRSQLFQEYVALLNSPHTEVRASSVQAIGMLC